MGEILASDQNSLEEAQFEVLAFAYNFELSLAIASEEKMFSVHEWWAIKLFSAEYEVLLSLKERDPLEILLYFYCTPQI